MDRSAVSPGSQLEAQEHELEEPRLNIEERLREGRLKSLANWRAKQETEEE